MKNVFANFTGQLLITHRNDLSTGENVCSKSVEGIKKIKNFNATAMLPYTNNMDSLGKFLYLS